MHVFTDEANGARRHVLPADHRPRQRDQPDRAGHHPVDHPRPDRRRDRPEEGERARSTRCSSNRPPRTATQLLIGGGAQHRGAPPHHTPHSTTKESHGAARGASRAHLRPGVGRPRHAAAGRRRAASPTRPGRGPAQPRRRAVLPARPELVEPVRMAAAVRAAAAHRRPAPAGHRRRPALGRSAPPPLLGGRRAARRRRQRAAPRLARPRHAPAVGRPRHARRLVRDRRRTLVPRVRPGSGGLRRLHPPPQRSTSAPATAGRATSGAAGTPTTRASPKPSSPRTSRPCAACPSTSSRSTTAGRPRSATGTPNAKFPSGMAALAERITDAGLVPGPVAGPVHRPARLRHRPATPGTAAARRGRPAGDRRIQLGHRLLGSGPHQARRPRPRRRDDPPGRPRVGVPLPQTRLHQRRARTRRTAPTASTGNRSTATPSP